MKKNKTTTIKKNLTSSYFTFQQILIIILVFLTSLAVYPRSDNPTLDIKWLLLKFFITITIALWIIYLIWNPSGRKKNLVFIYSQPYYLSFAGLIFFSTLYASYRKNLMDFQFSFLSLSFLFPLVAYHFNDIKKICILIYSALTTGAILSIYALFQFFKIDFIVWKVPEPGMPPPIFATLGNPNYFGWYMAPLIPLSVCLIIANQKHFHYANFQKIFSNLTLWTITALLIFGLLLSATRAAWVATLIATSFISIVRFKHSRFISEKPAAEKKNKTLIISFILLVSFLIIVVLFTPGMSKFLTKRLTGFTEPHGTSFRARLLHWQTSVKMITRYPFLGVGKGNYGVYYLDVLAEILSMELYKPYLQTAIELRGQKAIYAHNEYLHLASECGLIVLGAFVFFIIDFMIRNICFSQRILKTEVCNTNFQMFKLYYYHLGLMSATVAVLVCGIFGFPLELPATGMLFWLFLGIAIAIVNIVFRSSSQYFLATVSSKKHFMIKILFSILVLTFAFLLEIKNINKFLASLYLKEARILAERYNIFSEAIEKMEKAVLLDPHNGLAHYYLGNYYLYENNVDLALSHYEKAIKNYNDINLIYNLGVLYQRKGDLDNAKKYFLKVLTIYPHMSLAHYKLGELSLTLSKIDYAIFHFRKYLEIEGDKGIYAPKIRLWLKQAEKF